MCSWLLETNVEDEGSSASLISLHQRNFQSGKSIAPIRSVAISRRASHGHSSRAQWKQEITCQTTSWWMTLISAAVAREAIRWNHSIANEAAGHETNVAHCCRMDVFHVGRSVI